MSTAKNVAGSTSGWTGSGTSRLLDDRRAGADRKMSVGRATRPSAKGGRMTTAIVLVICDVEQTPETAQRLADLDGVREVYSVAGDFDLVAIVHVRDHEDLADV